MTTLLHPPVRAPGSRFEDADAFCALVSRHTLFTTRAPICVARAPGRFDVLGGIADYSGSLALELPTLPAALVAAQPDERHIVVVSGRRRISLAARHVFGLSLERLAARLSGPDAWAAYVVGPIAVLARELGWHPDGLRILVSSSVPEAKGLGSSAAIEIATLQAVAASLGIGVPVERLVLAAQCAEQAVAGAPCGAMDQTTTAWGEAGSLLTLLCRPATVVGSFALPAPLTVWAIDSGVTRAVSGAAYGRVRCAAFIGKALLGLRGHLTDLDPSESGLRDLPERLTGREFLRLQKRIDDPLSRVEPDTTYPVRAATLHPIEEHARVRRFIELIANRLTDDRVRSLGELMYQSHASYTRCGIGTVRTDAIVDAVRRAGWERGLVGARVSGGGSGGAVVVIGCREAEPLVAEIANSLGVGYVGGSSDGAVRFGIRTVVATRRAAGARESTYDANVAVALP